MKMKNAFLWLILTSLIACAVGCGKTETPSPPPSEAAKAPKSEETAPSVAVQPQTQRLADTAKTSQGIKPPLEPAAKLAESAPAPVKIDAPKVPETVAPAPGVAPAASGQTQLTLASLSQDQVVRGLQEALGKGLQQAIARLGHEGGFLTNLNVKIPMPEKLQKVESALRSMKQDKLADDFVATMNHAAEQAVPEAGSVFADALKQMTIEDAKAILAGPNDAATQYFQKATQTNLYARFYPIVQKATQATGVTAAYKNLLEKANAGSLTQKLGGLGSAISSSLFDKDSLDIDAYVTNKAMDGLFKIVADEEKLIRQNPVARTSDLLQQVFGAIKK